MARIYSCVVLLTLLFPGALAQADLTFADLNSLCNKTFADANAVSVQAPFGDYKLD